MAIQPWAKNRLQVWWFLVESLKVEVLLLTEKQRAERQIKHRGLCLEKSF
jgi:hypothetical protein